MQNKYVQLHQLEQRIERLTNMMSIAYVYSVSGGVNPAIEEWINERDQSVVKMLTIING